MLQQGVLRFRNIYHRGVSLNYVQANCIIMAGGTKPFRELPIRKRMDKPEWLPRKGDDGEEPEYKLSLIYGVYHLHRFEVRDSIHFRKDLRTNVKAYYICGQAYVGCSHE